MVDSLDVPTDDPDYLRDLIKSRDWGLSVLFVDDNDRLPDRLYRSINEIPEFNAMPVFGERFSHLLLSLSLSVRSAVITVRIYPLQASMSTAC